MKDDGVDLATFNAREERGRSTERRQDRDERDHRRGHSEAGRYFDAYMNNFRDEGRRPPPPRRSFSTPYRERERDERPRERERQDRERERERQEPRERERERPRSPHPGKRP